MGYWEWGVWLLLSVPLQVFRPLLHKSRKKKRPQPRPSPLRCRVKACWVSAPPGRPPPARSSPPAVYPGTAPLSVAHPPRTVQGGPFLPQWPLERYVHCILSHLASPWATWWVSVIWDIILPPRIESTAVFLFSGVELQSVPWLLSLSEQHWTSGRVQLESSISHISLCVQLSREQGGLHAGSEKPGEVPPHRGGEGSPQPVRYGMQVMKELYS